MKKYLAILSVLVFAGSQTGYANMLGLENIETDASLEVSGQSAKNETDANDTNDDHRGGTNTRVRLGLNMDVTDGVKGRVEALRTGRQYGTAPTSVAGEEGLWVFQNAYIDVEDFLMLDSFRLGRQYGGRKGDLLLYYGPYNDDNLTVTSLDALSVSKKFNKINIMAATGKPREDDALSNTDSGDAGAPGTAADEANVSWVIFSSDELVPNYTVPLELGFYQGTSKGVTTVGGTQAGDDINLSIIDLRASINLMEDAVKLGLEYALNGGQANGANAATAPPSAANFKGNALLFNATYDNEEGGWGVHLKYANASGDDPSATNATADDDAFHDFRTLGWSVSDYRSGEILSNSNTLAATFGTGGATAAGLDTGAFGPGVNIINLGGDYVLPVMDGKFKAMLNYYTVKVNEVASGADDGVGTEIDLAVKYTHSENVHAKVGYATASPDKGILTGFAAAPGNPKDDAVTKLFAKLMVKWGGERQY